MTCHEGESVLDTLIRHGEDPSFSCRNGVCHVCMMRVVEGDPGTEASAGLSPTLQDKNYFLPCRCIPQNNLSIAAARAADLACMAIVSEKQALSDTVWRILLEPAVNLFYHAGQFIGLRHPDGQIRSYSLASVPHQDYFLELHIKRHSEGLVSRWLIDEVQVGDELELIGPQGHNFYQVDKFTPMLLAATGTGLAPLMGVARDALHAGHQSEIHLYHGAASHTQLYLNQELTTLQQQFTTFHYHPCIYAENPIETEIHATQDSLEDWQIHLAGDPAVVDLLTNTVKQLGAATESIQIDPFTLRAIPATPNASSTEHHNLQAVERDYPEPDLELWQALQQGQLLTKILDDFYDAVFIDPVLSPYFHNSTKQRSKEKVYSFYHRLISGEKVYLGDRPRNAHHWMVISDEIFDHREALLKSFMLKHGLEDEMVRRWVTLDELYRTDIVKSAPRGRRVGDLEAPAHGYGRITLSTAGLCDACEGEIATETEVIYHLRTGQVFCPSCSQNLAD